MQITFSFFLIYIFKFNYVITSYSIHYTKLYETKVEDVTVTDNVTTDDTTADTGADEGGQLHKRIKELFIEGGPIFMSFVLIALILGLALAIERIIYLNLADVNTEKLLTNIEEALETGGVKSAKEVCRNTRGPVASIFYQGLSRADQGIDVVEKSVISRNNFV